MRRSTPRMLRMVMTLLRRDRWSDAVAGMVTLRPCFGVPEAQILWCPEPARETPNPARRARVRSSVVVLGMDPVVVPPEVRRVSWVLVVVSVPEGLMVRMVRLGSWVRMS